MQFLQFQLCDFSTGAAIPFGKCFVYLAGTATLASLFDVSGTGIGNPAVASSLAQVGFAAADGLYDFQPAYANGTSAGPKIVSQRMFDTKQTARILLEAPTTPQQYYLATDSSFGQCIQRALDDLRANHGTNGGGPDAYRGSPPLCIPAGDYTSNIPIDIYHTVDVYGHGSGDGGPAPAIGATHIKFTGCSGFRIQFPYTYGDDGVDVTLTRGGAGRAKLRMMMLSGDYAGVNTARHAVVHRCIADIEDIYARDWGGLAVRCWTGNVRGTNYSGNTSTSSMTRVKGENCVGTFSILGTDSNVIQTTGCQGYQNRQFGGEDGNAAGANKHRGMHNTYNGLVPPSAGPFCACSQSGNIYTPDISCVDFSNLAGLSALLNAHAPSGTTAHTSYWRYVQPGAPTAATPAYASGGPWIYGGDMLSLTPWSTEWDSCYMEGGGLLSQSPFRHPVWNGGTIDQSQINGGTLLKSTDDAFEIIRTGASNLIIRSGGGSVEIAAGDFANVIYWFLNAVEGGPTYYHTASGHKFEVESGGIVVPVGSLDYFGLRLENTKYIRDHNDLQVLGSRLASLPADATDLATVITLANAIKARLKATGGHGLVAD